MVTTWKTSQAERSTATTRWARSRGGRGRTALLELQVPGDVEWLSEGQAHGDVHADDVARKMIRQTIKEHFDREMRLRPLGIKVLSLFFVDHVDSYRVYNADNTTSLGPFGTMFEEEYRSLAKRPEYAASLFTDAPPDPASAHDGYFSRDKRGAVVDAQLNAKGELKNQAAREAAERGYQLIMRHKERLLSETEPLRFIFSHSALREGWDNPNVFQICVLRAMGGERQRRQTIGRGLRLCVDATGERRRDEGLNSLTVIADETFEAFASGLQTEMEQDLGVRFGVVEAGSFATLSTLTPEGTPVPLGMAESKALFEHLRAQAFVDAKGEVQDSLRMALKAGTLALPDRFDAVAPAVRAHLTRLARRLEVRNAAERRVVTLNRQVFLSEDFRALWDSIKARTTYRLHFDPEALIRSAAEEIAAMPAVARAQIRFRRATLAVERSGLEARGETTTDQTSLATNARDIPGPARGASRPDRPCPPLPRPHPPGERAAGRPPRQSIGVPRCSGGRDRSGQAPVPGRRREVRGTRGWGSLCTEAVREPTGHRLPEEPSRGEEVGHRCRRL